jgi:segregation and condensation protein B
MTDIDFDKVKQIVEAALLAADEPLTVDRFVKLFKRGDIGREGARKTDREGARTTVREETRKMVREALRMLTDESEGRGYELKRVASGYRYQVRQELSPWVSRLWEEKPPRYSRALLETLALVAYKQPVTRGDIEQVRGVAVSPNIMRTLLERGWIRVVGQREVPGRPNMYGTTRAFLDYFNLTTLEQLPPLAEIKSMIEPIVMEEPEPRLPQVDLPIEPDASSESADTEDSGADPDRELAEVVRLPTAPH